MADTTVETTSIPEITAKDLKGHKEAAVEIELEKENGGGDAPTNGNGTENGASHGEEQPEDLANEENKEAPAAGANEEKTAENGADEEIDGSAGKRPAEKDEHVETKKQKTDDAEESTEAELKSQD